MPFTFDAGKAREEPLLLFDQIDSSALHAQTYWGLRNYGPYDKRSSVIRTAILAPRIAMQDVERLIHELNSGTTIFPGGMPSFFRCKIEVVARADLGDHPTLEDYERQGLNLVKSQDTRDIDIILSYVPMTSKFFYRTPYYRLKAIAASHGFSTQMVTPNTFKNLKWSHLNLATGIFAKAGRIPWVLGHELNVDMILGLDISHVIALDMRAGGFKRYIGYVNVFDSYGRWLFFEGLAEPYTPEAMNENMQKLLLSAIQKYRAIKHSDPESIAIHLWKRFSRENRLAAGKAIRSLLSACRVMFISVDSSHPFRLFDLRTKDGSFPRGSYVDFGGNNILMSTTGESSIAGRKQGTPRPLHVRYWSEEGINKQDVVEQVLALTKLNWASATPMRREPVSLTYSQALAHLTAAVSEQEWGGITSPVVSQTLSTKPWFL